MKKISINNKHEYDCYIVILTDDAFDVILDYGDVTKVVNDLSKIETISLYDDDILSNMITDYTDYSSISLIKRYFCDIENVWHDAIRVNFKKVTLEEKVAAINNKIDELSGTVDESAMNIEEYKLYKKSQIGDICRATIYNGVDVETSYGKQHFSYTDDDQRNIKVLFDAVDLTKIDAPYHADGELCSVYTCDDIIKIYTELQTHLLKHTTYCNALNSLIYSQSNKQNISKITYGQDLPENLKENMDKALEQGIALISQSVTKY